jgi:hypothetical protein
LIPGLRVSVVTTPRGDAGGELARCATSRLGVIHRSRGFTFEDAERVADIDLTVSIGVKAQVDRGIRAPNGHA